MLRVYGMTFGHGINYGSSFQAYALQTVIDKIRVGQGIACDYKLITIRERSGFRASLKKRGFSQFLYLFYRTQFLPFEKHYMKFAPIHRIQELTSLNDSCDAFVCGSDVIWNPDFNRGLGAFYLDFAYKYKFSYAASFGKAEIPDEIITSIKPKLSQLNDISVRESSGIALVKQCTGKQATLVADPVLLLNKNDWNKVAEPFSSNEKYIFVYVTHLNQTIRDFINKLHKESGLKVVYSAYGPGQALRLGIIQVQKPERWLQQLRESEYVITNSFHATIFSILFHKKFFTVVHGEKDKGINIRMHDFLHEIGLSERLYNAIPNRIGTEEIDFSVADATIDTMRERSLAFLKKNLEAAYEAKCKLEMNGR